MYGLALLVLLALVVVFIIARGLRRGSWLAMAVGLGVATVTLIVFGLFGAQGAILWLDEVGFGDRLWAVVSTTVLVAVTAALAAALLVDLVTLPATHASLRARRMGVLVAACAGAAWGVSSWSLVGGWVDGASKVELRSAEASRLLFTLALVDALLSLLLLVAFIATSVTRPRGRIVHARPALGGSPTSAAVTAPGAVDTGSCTPSRRGSIRDRVRRRRARSPRSPAPLHGSDRRTRARGLGRRSRRRVPTGRGR